MKRFSLVALGSAMMLAGCGGGDGSSTQTGSFSLGVSDNPANVERVVIGFRQVVLKSVGDNGQTFSFEVAETGQIEQVDLLQFTGSQVETLVANQQIPVGEYQLCIYMRNDETGTADTSFVDTGTAIEGLTTPSNGSCGGVGATEENTGRLFFNKPFLIAAGDNNFVAEFNLEKGLIQPPGLGGTWRIKPTAVQLVNNTEVGSISGSIAPSLVTDCQTAAATGTFAEKVYLYSGSAALPADASDPTINAMVDFRLAEQVSTGQSSPIAAAQAVPEEDGLGNITGYNYELAFVAPGDYSLGFTCLAQNDDPERADTLETDPPFFLFAAEPDVTVSAGEVSVRNFPSE
ncbi:DUF4382 domain-containing protein [Motiliproteus sp. SC1-56]|uniref:DUF4382 domain-containing protein n=1 Tax=Motiliproteus sp. SC1-56 TaxID=2799565 RepID=UPI001A8ECD8B|nr:DUF4382 domain-containing protein [Motiliproteus sp. SC1-56]